MYGSEWTPRNSREGVFGFMEFAEHAVMARSLEEIAGRALPALAEMMRSSSALLYIDDPRQLGPLLFEHAPVSTANPETERLCAEQFARISPAGPPGAPLSAEPESGASPYLFFPLQHENGCVGLMGLAPRQAESGGSRELPGRCARLLACAVDRVLERAKTDRQLRHLNTYLTVSSMLAQPLGLHELLETILYSCIEVTSAEEASILLLDDEKKNFCFYQVEGPSKPVLVGATFPADRGIAGSTLRTQQSEIIHDVPSDPRFYGKIDADSGFKTRNMIVVPLTAEDERIGVLEVLNKADGGTFMQEEHHLLLSIAGEIAFAIRNAKMFEYVVNSYCKQRQGLVSCKGCKRPLGSWTPCVRYREASL